MGDAEGDVSAEGWRQLRHEVAACATAAGGWEVVSECGEGHGEGEDGVDDQEAKEQAAWAAEEREELTRRAEAAWRKRSEEDRAAMFEGYA